MFEGRKLLIATKHKKDIVLSPILFEKLKIKAFVIKDFDTDVFGTFTGDKKRLDDPIKTLRLKAERAFEMTNIDLIISSEGSFGNHPSFFYTLSNQEILMLKDFKYNLEIIASTITFETNYKTAEISSEQELIQFAQNVHFPSHGVILRKSKDEFNEIYKGINSWKELDESFQFLRKKYNRMYIETDMRANYNPTRMKQIERTGFKLIENIKSCCPKCNTPGFSITNVCYGLPCKACNSATDSILSVSYTCQKCQFTYTKHPEGKPFEDPMYCNTCNP
jgi:hypothetical protein